MTKFERENLIELDIERIVKLDEEIMKLIKRNGRSFLLFIEEKVCCCFAKTKKMVQFNLQRD